LGLLGTSKAFYLAVAFLFVSAILSLLVQLAKGFTDAPSLERLYSKYLEKPLAEVQLAVFKARLKAFARNKRALDCMGLALLFSQMFLVISLLSLGIGFLAWF